MHKSHEHPVYSFGKAEKLVNSTIAFVFYYRLPLVAILLGLLTWAGVHMWNASVQPDKLKNLATVMTCGSVIIAIIYAILNYEYSQIRFKHDKKNSIDLLTFNIASKGHDPHMIIHFRNLKTFYQTYRHLADDNQMLKFHSKMEKDTPTRESFIIVFNYFECISVGLDQGIIDDTFAQEFFKYMFLDYYDLYGPYLHFLRRKLKSDRIYKSYVRLASKWKALY
jgi:hypothetical protein